jgi:hypothetical protein
MDKFSKNKVFKKIMKIGIVHALVKKHLILVVIIKKIRINRLKDQYFLKMMLLNWI